MWLPHGRYVGETDDASGLPSGVGTMYYGSGDVYAGMFSRGKPHGRGSLTSNRLVKVGNFTDGKLDGAHDVYNDVGVKLFSRDD